jgi:hypothetical protein
VSPRPRDAKLLLHKERVGKESIARSGRDGSQAHYVGISPEEDRGCSAGAVGDDQEGKMSEKKLTALCAVQLDKHQHLHLTLLSRPPKLKVASHVRWPF